MVWRSRLLLFTYTSFIFTCNIQLQSVRAANIKYDLTVDFPPLPFLQPLQGQIGTGFLTIDDTSQPVLSDVQEGIPLDFYEVEQLNFSLLGQTFTEQDDIAANRPFQRFPLVVFQGERLQGLDFAVNRKSRTGLGFIFQVNTLSLSDEFFSPSDGDFTGNIGAIVGPDFSRGIVAAEGSGLSLGRVKFRRVPLSDDSVSVILSIFLSSLMIVYRKRKQQQ
ncbi:hypothetical protein ACSYAD_33390, partial [Acaryochloris marina NIES-2412]|uniref:hypothetical protein n=1 Tax=Acaryochloris marina TaxID=155978 RepID=UPI004057E788